MGFVDKCLELLRTHLHKTKPDLPIPIDTLIDICSLCCSINFFNFNNNLYTQKFGLPMGSPISCGIACLFLELLESNPFQYIFPKNSHYFRYIDDALFIYPKNTNLPHLVQRLNDVEPTINFTYEVEQNDTIPFLDILIHNSHPHLSFEVYRKPTYKNDLINFFSHHSSHIKSGIIIGSYLRALRICSEEFLSKEESFILETFKTLKYPTHFISYAKRKAYRIFNRTPQTNPITNPPRPKMRPLFLPTNPISSTLHNHQSTLGFEVITLTSKSTLNILKKPTPPISPIVAGVYQIPCKECSSIYTGESSRALDIRINEHKRSIRRGESTNALFNHIHTKNHTPDFKNARMIKYIHDQRKRRIIEASVIQATKSMKQRPGFYMLSPQITNQIREENKIKVP